MVGLRGPRLRVPPDEFLKLGENMIYHRVPLGQYARRTRYRAHFGVDPWLVSYLWFLICTYAQPFPNGFKPVHLLWGLLFLHLYNSEPVNCTRVACDEKTFRKWAWFVVCALADLEPYVVSATTP
jgi:hypothetical protein